MFTKTLKQLWDEVEAKAAVLFIDIESPEFKLLKAMAERCHKIEVELGLVLDDSAPGEPAPGEFQKAAGFPTATDQTLAAAGDAAKTNTSAAYPANLDPEKKPSVDHEPVWYGHRHV